MITFGLYIFVSSSFHVFTAHSVRLTYGATLDFETQSVYTIEFFPAFVVEGRPLGNIEGRPTSLKRQADDRYVLTIIILDVNEPPVFSKSMYQITVNEGPV